jgi:hypothetical protein
MGWFALTWEPANLPYYNVAEYTARGRDLLCRASYCKRPVDPEPITHNQIGGASPRGSGGVGLCMAIYKGDTSCRGGQKPGKNNGLPVPNSTQKTGVMAIGGGSMCLNVPSGIRDTTFRPWQSRRFRSGAATRAVNGHSGTRALSLWQPRIGAHAIPDKARSQGSSP